MTDVELKKKCKERAKIFQQAMESCHSTSLMDCIEWFADRIAELETQNEKMNELINRYYEVCVQIPKEYRTMVFDSCLEDTRQLRR